MVCEMYACFLVRAAPRSTDATVKSAYLGKSKDPLIRWHGKISCQMTDQLSWPKNFDLGSWFADAFSQLLQLQFFQFAQVAEQLLVKSGTQPFSILKTEK